MTPLSISSTLLGRCIHSLVVAQDFSSVENKHEHNTDFKFSGAGRGGVRALWLTSRRTPHAGCATVVSVSAMTVSPAFSGHR